MTPKNIDVMFTRFETQNPHPQTELAYTNTYTLLVAVILSAQATDRGVNKATKELFKFLFGVFISGLRISNCASLAFRFDLVPENIPTV